MANNSQMIFDGTPLTVLTGATAVLADANYTVSGTNATLVQWDNSAAGDRWPMAKATLICTFTAAPDLGALIGLYYTAINVSGGTEDETVPTTTTQEGAHYLGSFRVPNTATTQYALEINISTLGMRVVQFHLYNGGGDTLEITPTAWTLEIEGFTLTPSV